MTPIDHHQWHTLDLHRGYPVRYRHPHKQRIFALVDPHVEPDDTIRLTRWSAREPAPVGDLRDLRRTVAPGPFAYDDGDTPDRMVWYPNFADPDLLAFWDGPLLAQDELQALEHPSLGAVRQALLAGGHATHTIDADGRPTPVLLQGLRRHVAIDVLPSRTSPLGLYGNQFQAATWDQVRQAVTVLDPPTCTNLVALAAPYGGRGAYTSLQIQWILSAAATAFAAVVATAEGRKVTLHTGFWGCGAFGGDRVLMALAQWVAASAAGIDELVFHTLDPAGPARLAEAEAILHTLSVGPELDDWSVALHRLNRRWGVSDGN